MMTFSAKTQPTPKPMDSNVLDSGKVSPINKNLSFFMTSKVAPLIDSNTKTNYFTAMEALAKAQEEKKTIVSLKDASAYARDKADIALLTGELVIHPGPDEKLRSMFTYIDDNNVKYTCNIPVKLQNEDKWKALKIMNGYHADGTPYFEFKKIADNHWELQFNQVEQLIGSGALKKVSVHREHGYYLLDEEGFPNGKKSSGEDNAALYVWRTKYGSFIAPVVRENYHEMQRVNISDVLSADHQYEVMVYE